MTTVVSGRNLNALITAADPPVTEEDPTRAAPTWGRHWVCLSA